MFRKLAIRISALATVLALLPLGAFAYDHDDDRYRRDRRDERRYEQHQQHEWRERRHREHEWREHEERERRNYYRDYAPNYRNGYYDEYGYWHPYYRNYRGW